MDSKIMIALTLSMLLFSLCNGGEKKPETTTTAGPEPTTMSPQTIVTEIPSTSTIAPTLENCNKCADGTLCDQTNQRGEMCLCNYPQSDGTYQTCVLEKPTLM